MSIEEFKEYVKGRCPLDTEEIHRFMDEMSDRARRVTFRLNTAYHTPDEVRGLLSELFGYEVPESLRLFPPFYTDFGGNITVGEDVFINACCHFQDHGGVFIGIRGSVCGLFLFVQTHAPLIVPPWQIRARKSKFQFLSGARARMLSALLLRLVAR